MTQLFKIYFPQAYSIDVAIVEAEMGRHESIPLPLDEKRIISIRIKNEDVQIPRHIYSQDLNPSQMSSFTEEQKRIAYCLYSRHHNGFIRESCVKNLLASPCTYSVPYIIQLLGEYVVEIGSVIEKFFKNQDVKIYKEIAEVNRKFMRLTRDRMSSYWNEYYRKTYPNIEDYPPFKALSRIT